MVSDKEIVITQKGYEALVEELHVLETTRRKEVAQRIKDSIQFGDLTENSEFDDAKNEQAFVEGRIAQINEFLAKARVIEDNGERKTRVAIGSLVTLKDLDSGEETDYQLVGSVEADPSNHRISNESPVGKAIMDRRRGETVRVEAPEGHIDYQIVSIRRPRR